MKNDTNKSNVFFRFRDLFGEGERGRSMYDSRLSGTRGTRASASRKHPEPARLSGPGNAGTGENGHQYGNSMGTVSSVHLADPADPGIGTEIKAAGVSADAGNSRASASAEKGISPENHRTSASSERSISPENHRTSAASERSISPESHSSGNRGFGKGEYSRFSRSGSLFSGLGHGRQNREKKFPWMEMLVIYVCILLAGALLPGIIGRQRKTSENGTVQTAAEQAGQSKPVQQSASQQNANAPEFERGPEGGPSETVYASQVTQLQNTSVPVEEPVSTSPLIEVESVTISADASWMRQNETLQMSASIVPENATYPALTWRSSDENVARVSPSGLVTSVSGGTAVISATTSNGLVVEYPIDVSYIERRMVLDVTRQTVENNSVGEEWSSTYKVNDEEITGRTEMVVVLGDTISVSSTVIESDEDPDIGTTEGEYTVEEDGLENGFVMQQEVEVEENEGEFAGNTASFLVTYRFSNP